MRSRWQFLGLCWKEAEEFADRMEKRLLLTAFAAAILGFSSASVFVEGWAGAAISAVAPLLAGGGVFLVSHDVWRAERARADRESRSRALADATLAREREDRFARRVNVGFGLQPLDDALFLELRVSNLAETPLTNVFARYDRREQFVKNQRGDEFWHNHDIAPNFLNWDDTKQTRTTIPSLVKDWRVKLLSVRADDPGAYMTVNPNGDGNFLMQGSLNRIYVTLGGDNLASFEAMVEFRIERNSDLTERITIEGWTP